MYIQTRSPGLYFNSVLRPPEEFSETLGEEFFIGSPRDSPFGGADEEEIELHPEVLRDREPNSGRADDEGLTAHSVLARMRRRA